ncbi:hypothetical protein [Alishewanella phage vB_AspM_Slickus01]|nr:hypothetical protein [Alishewanella phage vB_AspM_Slickus01]
MNKENLLKLSEFLMKNEVPFTMAHYRANIESDESGEHYTTSSFTLHEIDKGVEGCGTAGCALGWSPFVIPPSQKVKDDTYHNFGGLDLDLYAEETFGNLSSEQESSVFGYDWKFVDNSREGAAFRLAQLAKHNIVYKPDVHDTKGYLKARDQWVSEWEREQWLSKWGQANDNNRS